MQQQTGGSEKLNGYLLALGSAAVLSLTAIIIRHLTLVYGVPALVLAFWRDVFSVATLLPVLAWFRPDLLRVSRRELRYLFFYGLLLSIFNAFWTLSVAMNGAAVATVLVYCSTGFSALIGWWFLKETFSAARFFAVVFCMAGCVMVSGATDTSTWSTNLLGIFTGAFSGLSYAVYGMVGSSIARRGINAWVAVLYSFAFASVFLLLFNLVPGGLIPGSAVTPSDIFWLGKAFSGWGWLFLLAAGPTVLGFGLCNMSLSYLPFSIVNLIVTLEPVFTAIIAYFALNERFSNLQFFGSAAILAGVLLLQRHDSDKKAVAPEQVEAQAATGISRND